MLLSALVGNAALPDDRSTYSRDELAAILRHSPLPPPPADPTNRFADSPRAAALGRVLFSEKNLSANGAISCASCHQASHGFADGRALAKGLAVGSRHTPTILGAAYNHWYFWDGRTDSQWSQALQPFENPLEIGSDRTFIVRSVARNDELRKAYQALFGAFPSVDDRARFPAHARPGSHAWGAMRAEDRDTIDRAYSNLGKAIEAYERTLPAGPAPFDRYVAALRAGDAAGESAISPAAKRGVKLFAGAANCELCHSGPTFSDGQFHNIGLPLLPGEKADPGRARGIALVRADRFNGIGPFSDDPAGAAKDRLEFLPSPATQVGAFKTPSLRNVAAIAPYMHDGRFATLGGVLDFYAKGKAASRGRLVGVRETTVDLVPHLSSRQKADLIAFLRTLTRGN
ncbi:MAG: hypothetical protein JO359_08455 [Candidatus Eremiobacteraeota bacterium]|nr:hypothetical protein [Candidatus Eremiobacteraeota bacterium]